MKHQCTDCMVGQGRSCRCAESEAPTLGALLLMLPFIALLWAVDGAKAVLKRGGGLLFVIGCALAGSGVLLMLADGVR